MKKSSRDKQSSPWPLLLLGLAIFSCSAPNKKQASQQETSLSSSNPAPNDPALDSDPRKQRFSEETDTLVLDRRAAVFYQPDSLLMAKRMEQVGEEDFRKGADDYIYYINTSAEYLQKQGIPVVDAKDRKYLKFIMADGKVELIKLDTLADLWGMYFFDSKKKPYAADIISIEEEYKNYYR